MSMEHPSLMPIIRESESDIERSIRHDLQNATDKALREFQERKNGLITEIAVLEDKKRALEQYDDGLIGKVDRLLALLEGKTNNLELEKQTLTRILAEIG